MKSRLELPISPLQSFEFEALSRELTQPAAADLSHFPSTPDFFFKKHDTRTEGCSEEGAGSGGSGQS
jgi:hypothetical protein